MRTASLSAAAALLLAASPAFATSSIHCRTRAGGPDIWLTVPNERGTGISSMRILNGREEIVANAQPRRRPWIVLSRVNRESLRVTVVFGRGMSATLASLNASRRGVPYLGLFIWGDRSFRVRCYWDEDDPA
jgi:hypothetical protein